MHGLGSDFPCDESKLISLILNETNVFHCNIKIPRVQLNDHLLHVKLVPPLHDPFHF